MHVHVHVRLLPFIIFPIHFFRRYCAFLPPSFLLMIQHEKTQLNANRNPIPNPKWGTKVQLRHFFLGSNNLWLSFSRSSFGLQMTHLIFYPKFNQGI